MSSKSLFRAACVQLCVGRSIPHNIAQASDLIRAAAKAGAHYVQTPEQTSLMELDRDFLFQNIYTQEHDPALHALRALAAELKIWLHIGSISILFGERKAANRAFLISPEGVIIAQYDKLYMFDVQLTSGETYRESDGFQAGTHAVVANLPWCKLGMGICYDVRFPALFRAQAHAGAQILTAPAAFTKTTGQAHWHILQRARAIENGAFMISAAQGGHHENGRDTFGHSMIISPWGEVLAEAGVDPCFIIADIELNSSTEARGRIPVLQHERAITVEIMG